MGGAATGGISLSANRRKALVGESGWVCPWFMHENLSYSDYSHAT